MIVRPELISASSAPCASPLNNCERKLGQLIIAGSHPFGRYEAGAARARAREAADGKLPSAVSSRLLQALQVYEPRLQPNASGLCISGAPGTISTTS